MSIFSPLRKLLARPIFEGQEEKTRAADLLNTVLLFLFATPVVLVVNAVLIPANRAPAASAAAGLTVMLAAMIVFMRRGYVRPISVAAISLLLLLIGFLHLLGAGEARPVAVYYALIIVMAGLLLGGRGAIAASVASATLIGLVIYLAASGSLVVRLQAPTPAVAWLTYAVGFILIGAVLRLASNSLNTALARARRDEQLLHDLNAVLEQRVTARTRELALAAEVGRNLSQVRDLDSLLVDAVELIRSRFNLYYTQLYLTDPAGQALVMTAGTGAAGAELKRRNFRLPIGPGSLNGAAAAARQDVLVTDTAQNATFRPNPLLPQTRSELAVPLLVGDKVMGVLDLQSERPNTFTEDNQPAFDVLAAQLAVSIQNNASYAEAQAARAELEGQARRLTRGGWSSFLDAVHNTEVMAAAYEPEDKPKPAEGKPAQVVTAPITVVGLQLGALRVESPRALSEGDAQLVSAVADQVARQIESLRLLAQAEQFQAEAEEASRRRTGEGWAAFASTRAADAVEYNGNRVTEPLAAAVDSPADYVQTLKVRGKTIGEIDLNGISDMDDSAADLLETVADRLSAHLENLRLFEQTQKRAAELQTVAKVSATASTALESDKLLQSVVDLTRNAFGLYHAHVYLVAEDGQNLVLAAGSGEAGRQMLAQGWSIPLDRERSLVARAARSRQGVVENDVRAAPDFLPNPWLPDTRAELAVPLIVGDLLLGVFDVQSHLPNYFTEEDVRIQATLGAQVAVALQNARLYSEQTVTSNRLREMDRLKSTFLANMSHELRTPLNSVIGYTDVILEGLDGPLTEPMETDLRTIQRNGQHLLNLINDVLDMAKIESGKLSLSVRPFDLREVLVDIMDITSPLARDKNVELRLETASPSLAMEGDDMRLRQVVMNIVNNAIKFTDRGGFVALEAERVDDLIRVRVRDNGIGIAPDKLDLVFQEFMQVDSSTTRKVGGTGLGLPISRHLVALHGGRLWAESAGAPGQGSVFTFEVPVVSQIGDEH